jgi:hypothetical protein
MGLIRDALGSAMGSNQVNNGFGGGSKMSLKPQETRESSRNYGMQSARQEHPAMYLDSRYQSTDRVPPDQTQQRYDDYCDQYPQPPQYESSMSSRQSWNQGQFYDGQSYNDLGNTRDMGYSNNRQSWNQGQSYDGRSYNNLGNTRDIGHSNNSVFRPLALPQIAYGDGQPFVRGYSNDLSQYGISPEAFIQVLDAINVASIPSPENQIFQKGANIAGWFL